MAGGFGRAASDVSICTTEVLAFTQTCVPILLRRGCLICFFTVVPNQKVGAMQNDVSRFVVNIVPLQNVQTNTSGLDATTALSNSIGDIQKMVNYSQRTIFTDFVGSLTSGGSVGFNSALNLCNVGILSNGSALDLGSSSASSSATISTLSTATSMLRLGSGTGEPILSVASGGNTLFTLSTGGATFSGACYAQQFLTLSDERVKTGLRQWRAPVIEEISGIGTYVYSYTGSSTLEIGLLAHEVKAAFPDCVGTGIHGNSYVKYDSLVALLVKAVRELRDEVRELRAASQGHSA